MTGAAPIRAAGSRSPTTATAGAPTPTAASPSPTTAAARLRSWVPRAPARWTPPRCRLCQKLGKFPPVGAFASPPKTCGFVITLAERWTSTSPTCAPRAGRPWTPWLGPRAGRRVHRCRGTHRRHRQRHLQPGALREEGTHRRRRAADPRREGDTEREGAQAEPTGGAERAQRPRQPRRPAAQPSSRSSSKLDLTGGRPHRAADAGVSDPV